MYSQISFSHSFGCGVLLAGISGSFDVVYSPCLSIVNMNENATLSLETHLGLGMSGNVSENGRTEPSGSRTIGYELPLVFELN